MKRIFIDIETIPAPEDRREFVWSKLQKSLVRKGLKMSDEEFFENAEKAFQNTALHASLGRLLCIGLFVEENGQKRHEGVFGMETETGLFHLDEAQTLQKFWNYLNSLRFDLERDKIIGHNILGFDLPFLYQRSMICQVQPSRWLLNGKPWEVSDYIYDTMERWQMGKYYEKVSLEELALAFELDCPKKGAVNAENLLEALADRRHREIREYCLNDVRCTRQLYYRMTYQTMPEAVPEQTTELALSV